MPPKFERKKEDGKAGTCEKENLKRKGKAVQKRMPPLKTVAVSLRRYSKFL